MNMTRKTTDRLVAVYEMRCAPDDEPEKRARELAVEQSVEIPESFISPEIEERSVARVEELTAAGEGVWRIGLSFETDLVVGQITQLLNQLYGNVSLETGVRLVEVGWPRSVLDAFPGPRFGIPGLREICVAPERRPMLCTAVKPVGLSPDELADLCRQFAAGGIDLIKDDHSLGDQPWAPFRERVSRCQAAVEEANAATGAATRYFPNLNGRPDELLRRVEFLQEIGCRGVVVAPSLVGLETVRWLAAESGLAVLSHPAYSGAFFGADHGIAQEVLFGQIFRVAGCDGVIYINPGGRFNVSLASCLALNENLRAPLGDLLPAMPVPGGGVELDRVGDWVERYGVDTMFLIGSSFYRQPDIRSATARVMDLLRNLAG